MTSIQKFSVKPTFASISNEIVIETIAKFLGLKEALKSIALVEKFLYRLVINSLKCKKDLKTSKLEETSGRLFCELIEYGRSFTINSGVVKISREAEEIYEKTRNCLALRSHGYMKDLNTLNAAMYTYWKGTPGTPKRGAFKHLQQIAEANPSISETWSKALNADCKYWLSSRISGDFFVLFERVDGTVFISADYKHVYLVLGLAQTVGEIFQSPMPLSRLGVTRCEIPNDSTTQKEFSFSFHGPIIGMRVATTLLPWEGKIVYDGLMIAKSKANPIELKNLQRLYIDAVDRDKLIWKLPLIEDPSLLAASNGAGGGNGSIVSQDEIQAVRTALDSKLKKMASISKYKSSGKGANDDFGIIWVFRRHGYNEKDNPDHLITVLTSAGGTMKEFYQTKKLLPSITEYVDLLYDIVRGVDKKPQGIAIDAEEMIEPLREVLTAATGVEVHYYPPPSEEEMRWGGQSPLGCAVCGRPYQENGNPLMRCTRCKNINYCCREHQKLDWKLHKLDCKPI